MKLIISSALVSLISVCLFFSGFTLRDVVNTKDKIHYIVPVPSVVKDLEPAQKTFVTTFSSNVFHRADASSFSCLYGGKGTCQAVFDGKPMEVVMTPEEAKLLLESTKTLWGNEGYYGLSKITCELGGTPKCQILGMAQREPQKLEEGNCVVSVLKG